MLCLLSLSHLAAHPMPSTLIEMTVLPRHLLLEISIPSEYVESTVFKSPSPIADYLPHTEPMELLRAYFARHLSVSTQQGEAWQTILLGVDTLHSEDPLIGPYSELRFRIQATPPAVALLRSFLLRYDGIMHQLVTHNALLSIRQDWGGGLPDGHEARVLATIRVEPSTGEVLPVAVNLEEGSTWKGFRATVMLGAQHIAEGYDHLLFLLLLLLVAPLRATRNSWDATGSGEGWGLWRLLKIVTAFTFGHSLTLAVCTLGWVGFPSGLVEVLIAVSILASAVHALVPLFFRREMWVACGFGLVHGMAFSDTLRHLALEKTELLWSLLGFNLGIEGIQAGLVMVVAPMLFALSRTRYYAPFRWAVGAGSVAVAMYWVWARSQ